MKILKIAVVLLVVILLSGCTKGKEIETVAGTIVQSKTDHSKWYFINNAKHKPINVLGEYAIADDNFIVIKFKQKYKKIISFIVTADETLTSKYHIIAGSSVDVDKAYIQLSTPTSVINPSVNLDDLNLTEGNLWFIGIFEK